MTVNALGPDHKKN